MHSNVRVVAVVSVVVIALTVTTAGVNAFSSPSLQRQQQQHPILQQHRTATTSSSSSSSLFASDDNSHERNDNNNGGGSSANGSEDNQQHHPLNRHLPRDFRRRTEFTDLEPIEQSTDRIQRIQQEQLASDMFVKHGDDLWELRELQQKLSHKLVKGLSSGLMDRDVEDTIRRQLRKVEQQDPELVYKMELIQLHQAKAEGRDDDAKEHSRRVYAARSCLPQYNLDGLWVGKYGHHGYEMINVTYHGDLLLAYKVTGDKNVPRGELTFQVDLSPLPPRMVGMSSSSSSPTSTTGPNEPLQPISLTEKAAKKWGTKQLPRHKGLGQVAEPGFTNNQWMDGQLIIIGEEYFSFAWVPIEQQIFFGRPSPELALKMLRESGASTVASRPSFEEAPSIDSDVKVLKDFVSSCLEKTTEVEDDELAGDSFSCIWSGMDTEECYFQ